MIICYIMGNQIADSRNGLVLYTGGSSKKYGKTKEMQLAHFERTALFASGKSYSPDGTL